MKPRQAVKDLVKAVSLANLCFIDTWTELLGRSDHFGVQYSYYVLNKYVAVIINVLLVAAVLWGAASVTRHLGNRFLSKAGEFGFLLLLFFCLNRVITRPLPYFTVEGILGGFSPVELATLAVLSVVLFVGVRRSWRYSSASAACLVPVAFIGRTSLLVMSVILIAVVMVMRKPRAVLKTAPVVVMALFPFALMTFFQASWLVTKFGDKRPATAASRRDPQPTRVVWLLFDELDNRLAFTKRPEGLSLPEFDRLRGESLFASNAYPPADRTLMSMPALITGRMVSGAEPVSPSELMITYADTGETVRWGSQPNLFSKARESGLTTAVVGWYHPYCRIIGDSLTKCSCEYIGRLGVAEAMSDQLRKAANIIPFASQEDLFDNKATDKKLERRRHLSDYLNVLGEAKRAVADTSISLTLVHLPVPHAPSIYDRQEGSFEVEAGSGYLDSLALADRTLGELRLAMEAAGVWENTTLLITSDHWWRFYESDCPADVIFAKEEDHRVPFIVKLAGRNEAITYEPAFNNLILHDLVLELLGERLPDPGSLARWIDGNRSTAEPYCKNWSQGNDRKTP